MVQLPAPLQLAAAAAVLPSSPGKKPSKKSLLEGFPVAESNMYEKLKKAGGHYTVFNAEEPFGPKEADAARGKSRNEIF